MVNEKRLIPLQKRIIYAGDVFNSLMAEKRWSATEAADFIKEFRTVAAVEAVHGRWEKRKAIVFDDEMVGYRCSNCNTTWDAETNYCPNCGAKMDGGDNDAARR